MRVKFFFVPAGDFAASELEVNRFLASHRVVSVDRELVQAHDAPAWALCVRWIEGAASGAASSDRAARPDYRELLNDADFAVFAQLRSVRKSLAERDGVPPYAVFTNEQLAAIAQRRPASTAALQAIDGIGAARSAKYATAVLAALAEMPGPPAPQAPPETPPAVS